MINLVVLNHTKEEIHIYHDISPDIVVDENYVMELGYNISDCSWQSGEDITVIEHRFKDISL